MKKKESGDVLKIRKGLQAKFRKKKPKFKRQEWFKYDKLEDKWRRPKGRHSKLRKYKGSKPKKPSRGYGTPAIIKGLHPTGYEDVIVNNIKELELLDKEKQAARFSAKLGKRKRQAMLEKAGELKIKVLNPRIKVK